MITALILCVSIFTFLSTICAIHIMNGIKTELRKNELKNRLKEVVVQTDATASNNRIRLANMMELDYRAAVNEFKQKAEYSFRQLIKNSKSTDSYRRFVEMITRYTNRINESISKIINRMFSVRKGNGPNGKSIK